MIIKAKSYFATPFLQMSFPGFLPSCHSRAFSLLSFPGILPLSHPRASIARPGDLRIFGSSPNMTVRKMSPTSNCRRHAERVFRGSKDTRQGLTICTQKATRFNKGSRRSLRALKGVPLSSRLQLAIFGLDPNIQEIGARIKPEHDRNA